VKRCNRCGETKPLDGFYRNPAGRDGRRPECKACTSARRKLWYQQNRDREIDRVRHAQRANPGEYLAKQAQYRATHVREHRSGHLKRKFGLTVEAFNALADLQQGGCGICGDPPLERQHLHVDHDPATMLIRGLLCVRCNNGLGQFKESGELLRWAADYVEAGGFLWSGAAALEWRARARAMELRSLRPA
jgi:hypothetical protein